MRRLATLLLALAATAVAQAPPPPTEPGTSPALPDLGAPAPLPDGAPPHLARIDRGSLRTHAYWLADDAREGRRTAGKGQVETAKYVSEHFQRLGLKPLGDKKTFLQSYPLKRLWLDATTAFTFGDFKLDRDFAVLAKGAVKVHLGGRFADCGNGSPSAVPDGLAGKIPLVVLRSATGSGVGADLQTVQRYLDIAQQLSSHGATAGVICLLGEAGSLANSLNYRGLLRDHAQLRYGASHHLLDFAIPLLVLPAPAGERLVAHAATDQASGKLTIAVKEDDKATGTNVVAVLEGTGKKSEAVVFSAHHDHVGRRLDGDVFNGADDNASGTAGLLEIAEAFAQGGARPQRSIVFLSVSGEELGLWGSDWYAAHPTWPLDKIVANVNIDMIGRAGGGDGAIAMQVTPSHQHDKYSSIVRDAVALAKHFGIVLTNGDTYYERSDHFNFAKVGVPVVFFCDGEHPDYHRVTDTADRLDYVRMEAIARLAFWNGWQVANGKTRPQELGKQPDW